MASKLLNAGAYDAKNQLEFSLTQAFEELQPQLKPPFPLTIPNPKQYSQLNRAILYGILTQPHLAETHIKHLHAIVTDGYAFFVSLLVRIVHDSYAKLVGSVRDQLIWVAKEMVDVLGVGFDGLLVCLLRQIVGGDFSDGNLWLCFELVTLFHSKWDCLLEEEPLVLTSALFVYLRLSADHCRLSSNVKIELLKRLEIEFCVKMLREQFHLCMKIGRDLVRLLQDLVHVPEFQTIWTDLVLNPGEFRTPGFSDISQLYCSRTSSRYFLLRLTPEMETQLRFLLMYVNLGSQKRYQEWFAKKFLFEPERETLVVDLVRFICCAHHPSNETLQSGVIPRWAVVGWLLKTCRKNYVQGNVKLALFYDWLFFDEKIDNIMNIEPGMLVMVCSIPNYIDITHSLLDFLLLLAENYDVDRNYVILRGLSSAFRVLVQKGVVPSLDVLISCDAISPFLKERLGMLLLPLNVGVPNDLPPAQLPGYSAPTLSSQNRSFLETLKPCPKGQSGQMVDVRLRPVPADTSVPLSDDSVASFSASVISSKNQVDAIENLIQNLAEAVKKSNALGLQVLESILFSFVNLDDEETACGSLSPEILSSRIVDQIESIGYKPFAPLDFDASVSSFCCEIASATTLITRTFILSQHERMQRMLLFWARNGYPVGAHLLFYASSLACEAYVAADSGNVVHNHFAKLSDSRKQLFRFHVDGCCTILNRRKENSHEATVSSSQMDKEFVNKLVENAFAAYKCFLTCSRTILHKDGDTSLSKLLLSDLSCCSRWVRQRLKFFFYSIFHYLADLCTCEGDIIRFVVSHLDHADLVDMQFEIGLKKFSMFGENSEVILLLINNSLGWDCSEQQKLWGLIRSELAISKVQVEKIIMEFFCTSKFDANISGIAVAGLLSLCTCCAPTTELVEAIMLLPNANVFGNFAATTLATWVVSNASMLFDSLSKLSEKLNKRNGDVIGSVGGTVNHSAIQWLQNYFNAQGLSMSNILSFA